MHKGDEDARTNTQWKSKAKQNIIRTRSNTRMWIRLKMSPKRRRRIGWELVIWSCISCHSSFQWTNDLRRCFYIYSFLLHRFIFLVWLGLTISLGVSGFFLKKTCAISREKCITADSENTFNNNSVWIYSYLLLL